MSARRTLARLLALLRKQRSEAELEEEIRAHLELAEDDGIARGLPLEDARREARRLFGGIEQMKEEHRDRRGIRWIETLFRDFRYGLASLRRAPGFATVVIGVLAVGIGGTVAMFSVVEAVLVVPLPFPEPDRIVGVWEAPCPGTVNATSAPQFLAWKHSGTAFAALAAEQSTSAALFEKSGPTRLSGKLVTSEYFKIFDAGMTLGRTFTSDEDRPEAANVMVLSHSAWRTYFGADPHILNRRVVLDAQSYQVIGVLQPGVLDRDEAQFWRPLVFSPAEMSSALHWLTVYGRLRAGVTVMQARQQMQAVYAAHLTDKSMDEDREGSVVVESFSRLLVGANLQRSITVAFGAVFLVLLIACANVTNLLFARGAARRSELAVRAALGAGRRRLLAQLLTECLALCVLGGASGVAIAFLLIRLASPFLMQALPFTADVKLDINALAFTAILVLGVALLTGALPALQTSFGDLADSLKGAARGSDATHISGLRLSIRRAIVIGEVGLSLLLLCGAMLLLRSLLKLQHVDPGVRIEDVIATSVALSTESYPTPEKAALFYQALSQRLRSVPGVQKVGLSTSLPLQWVSNGEGIFVPGVEKQLLVRFKRVDPGYLHTLDIPLLAGRGIEEQDREGQPRIIVVNQALAERLAQAGVKHPVGTMVRLTSGDYLGKQPLMAQVRITGVIRNERTTSPGRPEPAVVYVPLAQAPHPDIKILVRSQQEPGAVMPGIRKIVREIDPNLPLGDVTTMEQVRNDTLSGSSRQTWLVGAFASVAVLLSAIGLYGVVSYSVTQRRRELGIRMALGARPSDVLSHVLQNALQMVAVGLLFGLLGVYGLTRVLASMLFEVSPLDPLSLAVACASMTAIGTVAVSLPARRAASFDPMVSLRDAG